MKAFLSPVLLSFVLTGGSFSAVSMLDQKHFPTEPVGEKVADGDPAQAAVKAFNEKRYLAAVLGAQALVEEGNPIAFMILGMAHESGNGIEKSHELALKNYRKAREAGSVEASYHLARLLIGLGGEDHQKEAKSVLEALAKDDVGGSGKAARYLGEGSLRGWFGEKPDFEKAKTWWEESAQKGEPTATLSLARLLDGEFGFTEKRDPATALKHYLNVAEQGYAPAMVIAGSRLLNGDEKNRDEKKARELLAKAIEGKQLDAYLVLGYHEETVTKSDSAAFAQYLVGAEAGDGQCMLKLASFHFEGRANEEQKQNAKEALAWFKKAGQAGQVAGHVQAATMLLQGEGLNIVEGYNHLVAAAESGLVDMQNEVGLLYLSGRLGIRDATAAASWFRRSANGKFPAGAYNLAALHEQGVGVEQNFDQAGRLYTFAANAGHAQSTTALGRFHAEGKGTKQDLSQAWALFSLAVERGDEGAKGFVEQVAALLKEDQMKKASEMLAEYQKKVSDAAKGDARK